MALLELYPGTRHDHSLGKTAVKKNQSEAPEPWSQTRFQPKESQGYPSTSMATYSQALFLPLPSLLNL